MIDRSIKVLTKSQLYQDFCYSHLEYGILRDILILTNPPLCLIAAALKHREQFNQGGEVLNQDRSGKNKVVIWTLLSDNICGYRETPMLYIFWKSWHVLPKLNLSS